MGVRGTWIHIALLLRWVLQDWDISERFVLLLIAGTSLRRNCPESEQERELSRNLVGFKCSAPWDDVL